jgi:hypothetical protein
MLFWIIQTTVLSIIFIFLVHYLIEFFKSTLTVPKIKDLVNSPSQKYQNMFNVMQTHSEPVAPYKVSELIPQQPQSDMKNELKSFLKKQMSVVESSTDISMLGSKY